MRANDTTARASWAAHVTRSIQSGGDIALIGR
jgi:hypothetical protein